MRQFFAVLEKKYFIKHQKNLLKFNPFLQKGGASCHLPAGNHPQIILKVNFGFQWQWILNINKSYSCTLSTLQLHENVKNFHFGIKSPNYVYQFLARNMKKG